MLYFLAFITIISSSSDDRVRGAIASEVVDLGGNFEYGEIKDSKISIHSFTI